MEESKPPSESSHETPPDRGSDMPPDPLPDVPPLSGDVDRDVPPDTLPDAPPLSEDVDRDVPPDLLPDAPPLQEDVVRDVPPAYPPEPPPAAPSAYQAPERMEPGSERTWAMISHLSILLNLVTGFLGPIVALVIYLAYKDRSRYVAYQAMQSFVFQLIFFIGAGILAAIVWIITVPLMIVLVGCVIAPLAILLSFVPALALVYGVVAAVQTSQGDDFRYWLVGEWVMPKEGSPGPV